MDFTKQSLRKVYKEKRKVIKNIILVQKSQQIAQLFFQHFDLTAIQTIHIFLPIRKQNELDTWHIIRQVWQDFPHIKVLSSQSNPTDFTLKHFFLNKDTTLQENQWGIPEATHPVFFGEKKIDIVCVPLLVFDLRGYRVGYGKGFYDRFLANFPKAHKVGLSLEAPISKITNIDKYDVPLDTAITPEKVYCFT